MNYWPSRKWKVTLSGDGSTREIEPELPFALVGSHELCSIKINVPEHRVAPIIYFLCCFEDTVEAWPLCSLAYSRWGRIDAQDTLLVGQTTIAVSHLETEHTTACVREDRQQPAEALSAWVSAESRDAQQDTKSLSLVLGCHGKLWCMSLHRPVNILGGRHPSTLRVHGHKLARCDHAIIASGASVWLIDLKASSCCSEGERVTKLQKSADPYVIGRMTVSLRSSKLGRKSPTTATVNRLASNVQLDGMVGPHPPLNGESGEPAITQPQTPKVHQPNTVPLDRAQQCETLAGQVTERLLAIQKSDSEKRILVVRGLGLMALILAVSTLGWLSQSIHRWIGFGAE